MTSPIPWAFAPAILVTMQQRLVSWKVTRRDDPVGRSSGPSSGSATLIGDYKTPCEVVYLIMTVVFVCMCD